MDDTTGAGQHHLPQRLRWAAAGVRAGHRGQARPLQLHEAALSALMGCGMRAPWQGWCSLIPRRARTASTRRSASPQGSPPTARHAASPACPWAALGQVTARQRANGGLGMQVVAVGSASTQALLASLGIAILANLSQTEPFEVYSSLRAAYAHRIACFQPPSKEQFLVDYAVFARAPTVEYFVRPPPGPGPVCQSAPLVQPDGLALASAAPGQRRRALGSDDHCRHWGTGCLGRSLWVGTRGTVSAGTRASAPNAPAVAPLPRLSLSRTPFPRCPRPLPFACKVRLCGWPARHDCACQRLQLGPPLALQPQRARLAARARLATHCNASQRQRAASGARACRIVASAALISALVLVLIAALHYQDTQRHTVAFVMTDGDNLQWLLGPWAFNQNWWDGTRSSRPPWGQDRSHPSCVGFQVW